MSSLHRQRPEVAVIGAGGAGGSLAQLLAEAGWPVAALWSRQRARSRTVARRIRRRTGRHTPCPERPEAALLRQPRLLILAVPDGALQSMASQLADTGAQLANTVVLHLSGASQVEVLAALRGHAAALGSLHPLAILTRAMPAANALRGVGFAMDGDPVACRLARRVVRDLGGHPMIIAPGRRTSYHLAASLVANDSLALMHLAIGEMARAGIPEADARQSLAHLLAATARRVASAPVDTVLTGPVVRGDTDTLERHLEVARPPTARLHRLLSQVLLEVARRGQRLDTATARRIRHSLARHQRVPR
jgi:predicted short-subunit dehydrogenase-like oxidoreductase (DUF2520 family)